MPISVQCSGCGSKFRADDKLAGRRGKCPKCSAIIEIKASAECQPSESGAVHYAHSQRSSVPASPTAATDTAKQVAPVGPDSASDITRNRPEAMSWFAKIRYKFKLRGLEKRLLNRNSDVRRSAARALGDLKDTRACRQLRAALNDPNNAVRVAVAMAIVKIGPPDNLWGYTWLLGDGNEQQRSVSLRALQNAGFAVMPALKEALRALEPSVAVAAVRYIGGMGGSGSADLLTEALGTVAPEVRAVAAETLGRLGQQGAVQPLIDALKDQVPGVRESVAKALGTIRNTLALEPLLKALGDGDSDVRRAAAEAIANIGDSAVIAPLTEALTNSSSAVRRAAAIALARVDDRVLLQELTKAMKCKSWEIRRDSAEAIGTLGNQSGVKIVTDLLADRNLAVRKAAVTALGLLAARAPLVAALYDANPTVRVAAAQELARLGDPSWREWVRGDKHDSERLAKHGGASLPDDAKRLVDGIVRSNERRKKKRAGPARQRVASAASTSPKSTTRSDMERFCTRKNKTISLARLRNGETVCVEHAMDRDCIEASCKYHLGQGFFELATGHKKVFIDYTRAT